jgi:hypothetical protein
MSVSSVSPLLTLPSNQGPFPPPALPSFLGTTPPPPRHSKQLTLPLVDLLLVNTLHLHLGPPVLPQSPIYMHAVVTTLAESLGVFIAHFSGNGGLPRISAGPASASPFRGLLDVHCTLRSACSPSH